MWGKQVNFKNFRKLPLPLISYPKELTTIKATSGCSMGNNSFLNMIY